MEIQLRGAQNKPVQGTLSVADSESIAREERGGGAGVEGVIRGESRDHWLCKRVTLGFSSLWFCFEEWMLPPASSLPLSIRSF